MEVNKRNREHEYLYTVKVRGKDEWIRCEVKATSLVEVSRVLKRKMNDIRYIRKVII